MDLVGDRRGQSIQIGAVLLFGALIIAFSSYQAFVVPEQNSGVEFNHNQQVQSQMQDLRNAIISVPGSTSARAVSVDLATRYPSRLVARNPGPPSGSLRTDGTTDMRYNVTIRNAAAAGETGDIWNGTARPYNTGSIVYSPNYNVYTNAPTTHYGQSVAYNQFRTDNLTLTDQAIVSGRDITLVALNGSLSRSSDGTTSVDVRPVSRSDDPIVVSNHTASSNVSVSVPTRLPQSAWEELLADEIDANPGDLSNDRYVADVTATDGPGPYYNLTITFERGVDYRLRMAKAGVGNGVTSEGQAYLTDVRGNGTSVANDTTTELVLEVRDEYNNPVQGVTVSGGVNPGDSGSLTETEAVSDSGGRVTFEYDASGVTPGTQQVNFSYRGLDGTFDREGPENVTMEVEVRGPNGGSGGGGDNSGGGSGSNLPDGAVAYSDSIENGEYDNTEPSYTASDFETESITGDLIIARDITVNSQIQQENLDSLTIEDGVTVETTNGKLRFRVADGSIDVSGATLIADGQIDLRIDSGSGTIDIRDARLQSDNDIAVKGNKERGTLVNELLLNNNGGTEADGGTYIVDNNGNGATLSLNQIEYTGGPPEKGSLSS